MKIGIIYSIPCKNCKSVYIGETGRTGIIRSNEHKRSFKSGDIRSKLVNHALETDHVPDFGMATVLAAGINSYESRLLLEAIFTKLQPAPLNEAMTLPSEYSLLF